MLKFVEDNSNSFASNFDGNTNYKIKISSITPGKHKAQLSKLSHCNHSVEISIELIQEGTTWKLNVSEGNKDRGTLNVPNSGFVIITVKNDCSVEMSTRV